ncbi:hypothetical protein Hanom_Chr09g00785101 [Helianthus anomalus]
MGGLEGGRGGLSARTEYFEGHVIFKKNPICKCKKNKLIGYTYTNNIGPLTKLFLWFRLVVIPLSSG